MIANAYDRIVAHYRDAWGSDGLELVQFRPGPMTQLDPSFRVVVRRPSDARPMWTYASCGMSVEASRSPVEIHMFSRDDTGFDSVELIVATAHYHRTGPDLDLHHSVFFGRSWTKGSVLDHGFLSLPYLDGSKLEWDASGARPVHNLWLIPVSAAERDYKRDRGVDALEDLFESTGFSYDDPLRPSLV